MLPAQYLKYTGEVNQETTYDLLTQQKNEIKNDPNVNFIYPADLNNNFPIDATVNNGGWVSKQVLVEVGAYSPKFNFLISFVDARKDKRHYINTRYLDRYGVDLLVALLITKGYVPLVATFMHRDSGGRVLGNKSQQHHEIIKTFNTNRKFNILISNMYGLDDNLIDVDYLHFVEGFSYEKFMKQISRIYRSQNYSSQKPLKVIAHISNGANGEKASDYQSLEKFVRDLNGQIQMGIKIR